MCSVEELAKERPRIVGVLDLLEKLISFEFLGREVAEVLVNPVGGEASEDLLVPRGKGSHLLDPGFGDVPVVGKLMVVKDHRRRHGREQPADGWVLPRISIQARVLLEVGRRVSRWLAGVAARTDEVERV